MEGDASSPSKARKMNVNRTIGNDDPRFAKARELIAGLPYSQNDFAVFEEIHCQRDKQSWLSNGFLQGFSTADGKKCRVCIYFPTQELQPHRHDIDEDFLITRGAVDLYTWAAGVEATEAPVHKRLAVGDRITVLAGTVHCLRADRRLGLVFHEISGTDCFAKRSTEFADEFEPALRFQMPSVFAGQTVLVTGANRGIGLGFAKAFSEAGARVIACCRDPSKADELRKVSQDMLLIALDLANEESVKGLGAKLSDAGVTALDYLVNNAGISTPNHPIDPVVSSNATDIRNVFDVNVVGTIMVTQACLPLLNCAGTKVVMNLSSQLASIERCWGVQGRYGGVCSYRMSRAASNMALRCFGGELREQGYTFIAMSPGHVQTDMGSAGGRVAPLTVAQSVGHILTKLAHSTIEDNGRYFDYDGQELPW